MPDLEKERRKWSTGVPGQLDARVHLALGAFMLAMAACSALLSPPLEWGIVELAITFATIAGGSVLLFLGWATYSVANAAD